MAKALSKAKLYIEDDEDVFVQIGNLTSTGIPSAEKTEVESSDMDSIASEYIAGLPSYGELAFAGHYNPDSPGQALAIADGADPNATTRNFRVDLVNLNKRFELSGFILRANITAELNNPYSIEGAIRISGAVNETTIEA